MISGTFEPWFSIEVEDTGRFIVGRHIESDGDMVPDLFFVDDDRFMDRDDVDDMRGAFDIVVSMLIKSAVGGSRMIDERGAS